MKNKIKEKVGILALVIGFNLMFGWVAIEADKMQYYSSVYLLVFSMGGLTSIGFIALTSKDKT